MQAPLHEACRSPPPVFFAGYVCQPDCMHVSGADQRNGAPGVRCAAYERVMVHNCVIHPSHALALSADIDLDDPVNAAPRQHDDDAGSIVVMHVPLAQLGAELQKFSAEGCHVFMGLYTLVAGMAAAATMPSSFSGGQPQ